MFIQISKDLFINMDRVGVIEIGHSGDKIAYIFHDRLGGDQIAMTEYGSLYNSDVKQALEELKQLKA